MPKRYTAKLIAYFFMSAFLFFPLSGAHAEFYKYIDENGKPHFVDDFNRIPMEYRNAYEAYPEKYDNLPDKQRREMIEQDQLEDENLLIEQQHLEDKYIQGMDAEEQMKLDEAAAVKEGKLIETRVAIKRGRVLVPVTLGYLGRQVNLTMLLDTGASTTVLHKNIAEALQIGRSSTSQTQVAGGYPVDIDEIKLDFVKVGPQKLKGIDVMIIEHTGSPVPFQGILGMNFLKAFNYSVDTEDQVIRWAVGE